LAECTFIQKPDLLFKDDGPGNKFENPQSIRILTEIHYRFARHLLVSNIEASSLSYDSLKVGVTQEDAAFFFILSAATFNHRSARFLLAVYLENGLIPTSEASKEYEHKVFGYIRKVNPNQLYFNVDQVNLSEYELRSQAEALENLYLGSVVPFPK
jgi:hypothetical protein